MQKKCEFSIENLINSLRFSQKKSKSYVLSQIKDYNYKYMSNRIVKLDIPVYNINIIDYYQTASDFYRKTMKKDYGNPLTDSICYDINKEEDGERGNFYIEYSVNDIKNEIKQGMIRNDRQSKSFIISNSRLLFINIFD